MRSARNNATVMKLVMKFVFMTKISTLVKRFERPVIV